MKKLTFALLATVACGVLAAAPACATSDSSAPDPQRRDKAFWGTVADGMGRALVTHFWGPSFEGYRDKCYFYYGSDLSNTRDTQHYWPQAHAMDVVVDAYERSGAQFWLDLYPLWWRGIPEFNRSAGAPGLWWNAYVDDMEWIVLAQTRMYATTGNEEYYETARQIYDDWIWPTWGPESEAPWHGGITWKVDVGKSKNACSNGPAAIAAARLYRMYGDGKRTGKPREAYLGEALKIYGWLRDNLYRPEDGGVSDNMNAEGRVSRAVYTYNNGTFIGAAVELYKILGDKRFLTEAVNAANYVTGEMSRHEGGVLSDAVGGDGGLFHGIFFRYFVQLVNEPDLAPADRERFRAWLTHQANTMYDRGLNHETMLYGGRWLTAPGTSAPVPLTSHLSGCMLAEAMHIMQ
jgi:predicted alpha-1,6-mannanase (GH76 family)